MKKIFLITILLVTQIVFGQQYARPTSDITNPATWNGTFTDIDETTPNDADYSWSDDNVADFYETKLGTVTDPVSSVDHIIRFRFAETDGGVVSTGGTTPSLSVYLYQGATLVASFTNYTPLSSWSTVTVTLTGTEADAITDYTDLRLRFNYDGGGGAPVNKRGIGVSWTEFQVPTASSPATRRIFNIN